MKNFFNNIDFAGTMANPNYITALQALNPHVGDPLVKAELLKREQAQTEAYKQETESKKQKDLQARTLAATFPQIFQQITGKPFEEQVHILANAGIDPKMAIQIAKDLKPDIKDKYNPVFGNVDTFENGRLVSGMSTSPQGRMANPAANPTQNPYYNSQAGQKFLAESAQRRAEKEADKTSEFLDAVSEQAIGDTQKLETLGYVKNLLPDFYQGPGSTPLNYIGKGFNTKSSKNFQDFQSTVSELVLDIAKEQKGAQSNYDIQNIQRTKPEASNTEEGNRAIIERIESVNERKLQYNEAAQEFLGAGGTRQEFKTRWAKYANAFPITYKDENGNIGINRDNLENWKDILFLPKEEFNAIIGSAKQVKRSKEVIPKTTVEPKAFNELTQDELDAEILKEEGR